MSVAGQVGTHFNVPTPTLIIVKLADYAFLGPISVKCVESLMTMSIKVQIN